MEKRGILLDSSSAVLLYKAGVISALMEAFVVRIPLSVYREITVHGQTGSDDFVQYVQNGSMQVSYEYKGCLINLPLAGGERDVVLLYLSGDADFIIIDDKKGASYCRRNRIPYINALLALRVLCLNGFIGESDYHKGREYLCLYARYSKRVIEYASNAGEDEISFFFPFQTGT
jgi:hypothetical protein